MSTMQTITINNYDGSSVVASFQVESNSELVVASSGLICVNSDGITTATYNYEPEIAGFEFEGLSGTPCAMSCLHGRGKRIEITNSDLTFYIHETIKINGKWTFDSALEDEGFDSNVWPGKEYNSISQHPDLYNKNMSIGFTSNGRLFVRIGIKPHMVTTSTYAREFDLIYKYVDDVPKDLVIGKRTLGDDGRYYWSFPNGMEYALIDFGEKKQSVPRPFYEFLTAVYDDVTHRLTVDIYDVDGICIASKEYIDSVDLYVTDSGLYEHATGAELAVYTGEKPFLGLASTMTPNTVAYGPGEKFTLIASEQFILLLGLDPTQYIVEASDLEAIANAIRQKTGKTEPILFENFASEILSIPDIGVIEDNTLILG